MARRSPHRDRGLLSKVTACQLQRSSRAPSTLNLPETLTESPRQSEELALQQQQLNSGPEQLSPALTPKQTLRAFPKSFPTSAVSRQGQAQNPSGCQQQLLRHAQQTVLSTYAGRFEGADGELRRKSLMMTAITGLPPRGK
ncbi:Nance-Horan syndrome protein [Lates japonicus]|uniref:Nance-Horan syndrome protein n=1 Tax=Lates japonicus TaxID=270547 RepID=A0AAD3NKH5_LATJO|nr:Nance-Horan syndrome protein [Lates japonicus]